MLPTDMTVIPVLFEPTRYFVSSDSRDMVHLVDTEYQEEPHLKPKMVCSCEHSQCRNAECKHVIAVRNYLHETTSTNP